MTKPDQRAKHPDAPALPYVLPDGAKSVRGEDIAGARLIISYSYDGEREHPSGKEYYGLPLQSVDWRTVALPSEPKVETGEGERCLYHATHNDRLLRCILELGHEGSHDCYPPIQAHPPGALKLTVEELEALERAVNETRPANSHLAREALRKLNARASFLASRSARPSCTAESSARSESPSAGTPASPGNASLPVGPSSILSPCEPNRGSLANPEAGPEEKRPVTPPAASDPRPKCETCGGEGKVTAHNGASRGTCYSCHGTGARPSPWRREHSHHLSVSVYQADEVCCYVNGEDFSVNAAEAAWLASNLTDAAFFAAGQAPLSAREIGTSTLSKSETVEADERIIDDLMARRAAGLKMTRLVPAVEADAGGDEDEGGAHAMFKIAMRTAPDLWDDHGPEERADWIAAYRFVRAEGQADLYRANERAEDYRRTLEAEREHAEFLRAEIASATKEKEAAEARAAELEQKSETLAAHAARSATRYAVLHEAWRPVVLAAQAYRDGKSGFAVLDLKEAVDAIPEDLRPQSPAPGTEGREG